MRHRGGSVCVCGGGGVGGGGRGGGVAGVYDCRLQTPAFPSSEEAGQSLLGQPHPYSANNDAPGREHRPMNSADPAKELDNQHTPSTHGRQQPGASTASVVRTVLLFDSSVLASRAIGSLSMRDFRAEERDPFEILTAKCITVSGKCYPLARDKVLSLCCS